MTVAFDRDKAQIPANDLDVAEAVDRIADAVAVAAADGVELSDIAVLFAVKDDLITFGSAIAGARTEGPEAIANLLVNVAAAYLNDNAGSLEPGN